MEKFIEEADIAGLKIKLDETGCLPLPSSLLTATFLGLVSSLPRQSCVDEVMHFNFLAYFAIVSPSFFVFHDLPAPLLATAEKVTVLDGRMEKMVLFLDKTNKKVIWVQEVLVPEVTVFLD